MSAKAFLLHECENVRALLDQSLRNDYGPEGSEDFFDECAARLEFVTAELAATDDADVVSLTRNAHLLNELSRLICRIERSSLGEYSWPFVGQLKRIAGAVCAEPSLAGAATQPKIYVLADGGLDAYAIYAEQSRPSASKRRLLTIVFPKSLKHAVLLHPILGHEVGHAIWRCSKHQRFLYEGAIRALTDSSGLFDSAAATAEHLFSSQAPQGVKDYLTALGVDKSTLFEWVDWEAWIEEILCDLIGLVTFGPGFVASHAELLYGLDPSGVRFGEEHPPVAWRVNFIRRGATLLGYDTLPAAGSAVHRQVTRFWRFLDTFVKGDPWFNVFPDEQLRAAVESISSLLRRNPPSEYPIPAYSTLESLIGQILERVPPIGFSITDDGKPVCTSIDFRHIIYAGWIVSRQEDALPFGVLNRLCEHAILQQEAITASTSGVP